MKSSDIISAFIRDLWEQSDGSIELRRNELAQHFHVVPSQISYVITSRFTPEHGYITESHRGGGGCIRIRRVRYDKSSSIMHVVNSVGKQMNWFDACLFLKNLEDYGYIEHAAHIIIKAAVSDQALSGVDADRRDEVRASIFKNTLLSLL